MTQVLTASLLISNLILILYQDYRDRSVSVWLFMALIILGIGFNVTFPVDWLTVLINTVLLLLILLFSAVIMRFRGFQLRGVIGSGDLIFFGSMALFMSTPDFVVFFNLCLLFSIVAHYLLVAVRSDYRKDTIPLAGFSSIVIIGWTIARLFGFSSESFLPVY